MRNRFKILAFKIFYSKFFENYLLNRRNKFNLNLENLDTAQSVLDKILSK